MLGPNEPSPLVHHPTPIVVAHMMTPGVVQVPGDVSVSEAALLLEREHAPCLLVKETDTVFGLMTPHDIVKKVVAQGLEPHDIEVRSIMTRPVQFIEYDELLEEASTMMVATGASVLIVTKENQPVGVLSAQDLMLTPPRRPINIPTVVTVVDEATPQRQAHNANIVQLSHVSARLESASSLHPKTRVVLAFSLPGQHTPLTIHGKVLSSETLPTTAAQESSEQTVAVEIQFADLSTTDLTRLKAWTLQAIPSPLDRP
ncbi:MAG TPA: CBS domain-containing protein [Nitrospira sp.]|nr:CBS domain-containing protein [Nitrospira sp.]